MTRPVQIATVVGALLVGGAVGSGLEERVKVLEDRLASMARMVESHERSRTEQMAKMDRVLPGLEVVTKSVQTLKDVDNRTQSSLDRLTTLTAKLELEVTRTRDNAIANLQMAKKLIDDNKKAIDTLQDTSDSSLGRRVQQIESSLGQFTYEGFKKTLEVALEKVRGEQTKNLLADSGFKSGVGRMLSQDGEFLTQLGRNSNFQYEFMKSASCSGNFKGLLRAALLGDGAFENELEKALLDDRSFIDLLKRALQ